MAVAASLGYPRIGPKRELKKALEAFWKGQIAEGELLTTAADLRAANWKTQAEAGIGVIPSNDFTLYDQVLDTSAMVGAVPARYGWSGGAVDLATYFAMARGKTDAVAMEMTKWFDTNYHYIVPEFTADQAFSPASTKPVDEYREAKALGIETRPVLVGPVTFLTLGKEKEDGFSRFDLLDRLLPVYAEVLGALKQAGAEWVQIDEPILALDLDEVQRAALKTAYAALAGAGPKLLIATYFEGLRDNTELAAGLPVDGLHVDLVRAPDQVDAVLAAWPADKVLSLGVVDGRNIWRTDLSARLAPLEKAKAARGGDALIQVASSCSLIHSPIDLAYETKLDAELKSWLAFARQKLDELVALATGLSDGKAAAQAAFDAADAAVAARKASVRTHNPAVRERLAKVDESWARRASPFAQRQATQRDALKLPLFPTTTIGSFPQTQDVRKARAANKRGELSDADYTAFLKSEIEKAVRYQEEIDLDVLVHGEFERNDMVEYFGEQLDGFAFTQNGWVQSYGSRYVKPPIIYGDVQRPEPMTVDWTAYAQSLTERWMKGMLTGPVTILQWSFVRDDQPRSETCRQIGLAIRDEVVDLEKAGIRIVQIDEPAFREGLPLRQADWRAYLDWAVTCFRLSASGVEDGTQIHTHMCYSEFNDIIDSIAALDADVISIETSRSDMELLDAFVEFKYPNEIGPGVWDIHSPRIPRKTEMTDLLNKATKVLDPKNVWVNPDCGLKTRGWEEVKPSLEALVDSAKELRSQAG